MAPNYSAEIACLGSRDMVKDSCTKRSASLPYVVCLAVLVDDVPYRLILVRVSKDTSCNFIVDLTGLDLYRSVFLFSFKALLNAFLSKDLE